MFISGKNQYNVPNSEPKPQSEPSDTACLIRKAPQIWHRINVLQPPPAPPGAPKHPRWVYYTLLPPKYKISHPNSPPTSPTASAPPDHCFWHCLHVFTNPPTPAKQPRPIIQPRPLIRHPRHINHPTHQTKIPYY